MKRICFLLCLASTAFAQDNDCLWLFEQRDYYKPLIAGVREAHLSALALGWATTPPFVKTSAAHLRIWDIDVGGEIPIGGWETPGSNDTRAPDRGFGIGLWIPIDFHMIGLFGVESNPILNNDYRFGGMVKAQYGLGGERFIAARFHLGHESTHLGDEYSLTGPRDFRDTFERINVSWEYLDVAVMYEDVGNEFSVRGGITATVPFRDGYYSTDPEGVTHSPRPVTPSKNWWDPYAGIEFSWERQKSQLYASTEIRYRSAYDYHKRNAGGAEDRHLSVNAIAGIKPVGPNKASFFVRFYRGVNPHGQFRNQKNFTTFGIGVRLVQ